MRILPFRNVNQVAVAVEKELRRRAEVQGVLRMFLPTGNTPLPLYALLRKDPKFWRAHLEGIQIDDFIDPSRPFLKQLETEIETPLGINLFVWEPSFTPLHAGQYVDRVLSEPIDIALLGLGSNGHVGFHEPGVSKSFKGGRVTVTEATRVKSKGPTLEVFTFGVAAFLKAKEIFLVVTGEEKREIFENFKNTEPTEDLPATLLKAHKNLTVFSDLD